MEWFLSLHVATPRARIVPGGSITKRKNTSSLMMDMAWPLKKFRPDLVAGKLSRRGGEGIDVYVHPAPA
jgi:hypothetical protein